MAKNIRACNHCGKRGPVCSKCGNCTNHCPHLKEYGRSGKVR